MKLPISEQSHLYPSLQPESEKTPSDFWKAVRTNLKLQHQTPPIKPVPRSGNLPLSFAQERLWFLDQMQPGSSIHNMRAAFRLKGSLNIVVLEKSLNEIVLRHEILRTTFPSVDGQPVQSISPEIDLKLPMVDLRELSPEQQEAEVQRLITEEGEQPFDLAQEPLWRFQLLRLTEEEYVLIRIVHHIIFDGWSYSVFMRELAVLYEAFSTGKPSPLTELPIQYADFAQSQRQWLQGEVLESQLDYWQKQLSGNIAPLALPINHPRPSILTYRGSSQFIELPKNLTEALKTLSHQESVSLFVILLTGFNTLLHQYTGQEDIILCSPVASRNRIEIKRLIGYFNNIVVLRTDLSGNPSFRELISRVSRVTLGAYEHQDLPFQNLADFPNLVRTPINRGMFTLHNSPSQPQEMAGITVSTLDVGSESANFDLFMSLSQKEEKLTGVLYYKTDLFEATNITQMLENFQTLLETTVANPDRCLEDLPLLISNGKIGRRVLPVPDQLRQEPASTFVPPSDDLEIQLTKIWENVLGKKPISVKDNFFEVGGHSLLALRLLVQIEKAFGKNLPLATLFQSPTVEQQAKILHQSGWSSPWFSLVPIQPSGSQPPFFAIHSLGKGQEHYRNIARHLGSDQPIYGLDYWLATRTKDTKEAPKTWSVEELAAHYIKEMQIFQPEGPYFLGGLSFAGIVAYEMAQQLVTQDQKVALLVLFDTYCPTLSVNNLDFNSLEIHLRNLSQLELKKKLAYIMIKVKHKIQHYLKWIKPFSRKVAEKFYLKFKLPMPYALHYSLIVQANSKLARDYTLQAYPGKVTLFRASDQAVRYDQFFDLGWSALAVGGLDIHEVPGDHMGIFQEPHVQILAEKLRVCIDKALQDVSEDHSSEPKKSTTEVEH